MTKTDENSSLIYSPAMHTPRVGEARLVSPIVVVRHTDNMLWEQGNRTRRAESPFIFGATGPCDALSKLQKQDGIGKLSVLSVVAAREGGDNIPPQIMEAMHKQPEKEIHSPHQFYFVSHPCHKPEGVLIRGYSLTDYYTECLHATINRKGWRGEVFEPCFYERRKEKWTTNFFPIGSKFLTGILRVFMEHEKAHGAILGEHGHVKCKGLLEVAKQMGFYWRDGSYEENPKFCFANNFEGLPEFAGAKCQLHEIINGMSPRLVARYFMETESRDEIWRELAKRADFTCEKLELPSWVKG